MADTPRGFGRVCGKELNEEDTRTAVLVSSFDVEINGTIRKEEFTTFLFSNLVIKTTIICIFIILCIRSDALQNS